MYFRHFSSSFLMQLWINSQKVTVPKARQNHGMRRSWLQPSVVHVQRKGIRKSKSLSWSWSIWISKWRLSLNQRLGTILQTLNQGKRYGISGMISAQNPPSTTDLVCIPVNSKPRIQTELPYVSTIRRVLKRNRLYFEHIWKTVVKTYAELHQDLSRIIPSTKFRMVHLLHWSHFMCIMLLPKI